MSTTYNIDRETASRLLDVSLRTVDRYVKKNKLSSIKQEGRVWLSKEEILDYLREKNQTPGGQQSTPKRQPVEADIVLVNKAEMSTYSDDKVDKQTRQTLNEAQQEELLQLRTQVAVKEQELQMAKGRIQELELKVSELTPLLELKEQNLLLTERTAHFEQLIAEKEEEVEVIKEELELLGEQAESLKLIHQEEMDTQKSLIENLDTQLHEERVNKWVYSVTLYVVIIVVVIFWMVLRFA